MKTLRETCPCADRGLRNTSLVGQDYKHGNVRHTKFRKTKLRKFDLISATLGPADLRGAQRTDAKGLK